MVWVFLIIAFVVYVAAIYLLSKWVCCDRTQRKSLFYGLIANCSGALLMVIAYICMPNFDTTGTTSTK